MGVGGTVVALGTTADGRLSGVKLTVTGVWMVRGLDAYEWGSCFTDLAAIQELLDAGDAAGVIVFRQRDGDLPSAPVAASVTAALRRNGIRARACTWEEMGGPFLGGMIVTRFVGGILHAVLAIIAAFGVLNTALMSVFERTREIGTIRAVGSRRSRVVALFLLEGLFLGVAGAVGRRAPRRRPRPLVLPPRHPRLQRGAALLLRRGLPLHDSRLARPRVRAGH